MGNVTSNVLAVNISKYYKEGVTSAYGRAGFSWEFGENEDPNDAIDLVLAVSDGEVVKVFEVKKWYECKGTKPPKELSKYRTDEEWKEDCKHGKRNLPKWCFEAKDTDGVNLKNFETKMFLPKRKGV